MVTEVKEGVPQEKIHCEEYMHEGHMLTKSNKCRDG
jgi:hypothetical protein